MKVLHITAHLGGGVGKVLSGIAAHDHSGTEHSILCLEHTQTPCFLEACTAAGVPVYHRDTTDLDALLDEQDIVQVEWWHHPLMASFLVEELSSRPCRLVVWSHISGCGYPCLPEAFVRSAEGFVLASPYSYENNSWSQPQRQWIRENTTVVVSSGNSFSPVIPETLPHSGFQVGYIGFLGYEKMHPSFAEFCEACRDIEGIHFQIGGDTSHASQLIQDLQGGKAAGLVDFLGYVSDVEQVLRGLDVFLYPLHPQHTGTAENALLEAMAAGVVPVVLDQCSEKHTVSHMETGLVIRDGAQCAQALRWLFENPTERQRLGRNAAEFVRGRYTIHHTIAGLHDVYSQVLRLPKRTRHLSRVFGETPYDWFLSCYTGDPDRLTGVAAGDSKGSVRQYARYFPQDPNLERLRGSL